MSEVKTWTTVLGASNQVRRVRALSTRVAGETGGVETQES